MASLTRAGLVLAAAAGLGALTFGILRYTGAPTTPQLALSPLESAWLERHGDELEILGGYDAPPNAFYDDEGHYVGVLVDFGHELEERLGRKLKRRRFETWDQLMRHAASNERFVIVGVAETSERGSFLAFTDSFLKVPYVAVTRDSAKFASMDDLVGRSVCTVRGYAINEYIEDSFPLFAVEPVEDNLEGLRAVSTGRCDAMVINQAYASYLIETQGLARLRIAFESGYNNRLSVAVSRSDPVLHSILDKAIETIPPARRREILLGWILPHADHAAWTTRQRRATLAALVAVTVVIVFLWAWLVSLRRTVRKQTARIHADYSALQHAEAKHRASDAKYRDLVEQSSDAIYLLRDGSFELVNQRFLDLFGFSSEDLERPASELLDFIAPESRALIAGRLAAHARGEQTASTFEFTGLRPDGTRVELAASANYMHYGEGLVIQGVLRDVTKQRQLERELLQAQKMEVVGQLAGGVAHDFNNLLSVINGYSEFALAEVDERSPVHAHLREILRAGERAAGLTRQLLAFGRRQVVRGEGVVLDDALDEMQGLLRGSIAETIDLEIESHAPEIVTTLDAGQLEQVVLNLVVNARDAMPDGGRLRVQTSAAADDPSFSAELPDANPNAYVVLSIADTGVGMDEATKARIFEPFFTTKERGKGTGLGLSTVFGIVTQAGGHIRVESAPRFGTMFRLYLRRAETDDAGAVEATHGGGELVLIVEDEASVRHFLARALRLRGYEVLEAASANAALSALERHERPPDLLLSDVVMPGMDGPELARTLRARYPGLPCLLISGYAETLVADQGKHLAGTKLLQKPIQAPELARQVRAILDARKESASRDAAS